MMSIKDLLKLRKKRLDAKPSKIIKSKKAYSRKKKEKYDAY